DVPLPDGTGDKQYLLTLQNALGRIWKFDPQIVFFQSGVDGLATDRLGRLALTRAGLAKRDEIVIGQACKAGLTLVITLGYGSSTVPDGTFRYTYRPRIWRTPYAISAIPSATAESLPTKDGAGFSRSSLVTVISASFSKDFALIPETILMNPTAIESQFSIG